MAKGIHAQSVAAEFAQHAAEDLSSLLKAKELKE